jgi:hypothetical protein
MLRYPSPRDPSSLNDSRSAIRASTLRLRPSQTDISDLTKIRAETAERCATTRTLLTESTSALR